MTRGDKWKDNWIAPDLTPPAGETIATTKYGWAVQHPEYLTLGNYVDIGYGTYINARFGVRIGDDVEIGGGCHIYSHNTIEDHAGLVVLEEGCMIGAQCVIFPGVTIGKGATVGTMSLVNSDVPAGATFVGVPARKIASSRI